MAGRPQHIAIAVRLNADGIITVDISDDGIGFQTSDGAGVGLLGMRERVQSLGDTPSARNRADKSGVIVTARLPYSVDEPGKDTNARKIALHEDLDH
jgi:signal transduction histidine kinase